LRAGTSYCSLSHRASPGCHDGSATNTQASNMTKVELLADFPKLETRRLVLERIPEIKKPQHVNLFSLEDLQILHNKKDPFDGAGPDGYILGHYGPCEIHWGIKLKGQGRIIGVCQFHDWNESLGIIKTSYVLESGSRGQGLMTEAMRAMLSFAFQEMGIRVVRAETHSRNKPSARLLQRLGFKESGRKKHRLPRVVFEGGDELIFSLAKDDFYGAAAERTAPQRALRTRRGRLY
jgi:ribosomal-protein-alanine N-acetyltransferase